MSSTAPSNRGICVILFGGTGMIGQGALKACLEDGRVASVLSVVRKPTGTSHPKVREVVHEDFLDFEALAEGLKRVDACLWCLGISSAGMDEASYTRVTVDYTRAFATVFARVRPGAPFVFISGQGTDGTERSRTMWARVKGRAENTVTALPLKAIHFRPGAIQPMDGIRSRTPLYDRLYTALGFALPLLRRIAPTAITTTRELGEAMVLAALGHSRAGVFETADIHALATEGRTTA